MKKSTEQFIVDAIKVHGNEYDYSKVNYTNSKTKVEIICKRHGSFLQIPNNHLSGCICRTCGYINRFNNKKTTEQFIVDAINIHGDRYDYSKVNYESAHVKVKIECSIHGEFLQEPNCHLKGEGCKTCGNIKGGAVRSKTTAQFVKDAIEVHNNKYNYSKVEYIKAHKKIEIICSVHGSFWQLAHQHLSGSGCQSCSGTKKGDTKSFIKGAIEVHGDKYDYSKVKYINVKSKVEIICPIHGSFFQSPKNHAKGNKCPKCYGRDKTTEEFIKDAIKVHGDKYDYSKVNYSKSKTRIEIICKKHGSYLQFPNSHLSGQGCPNCNTSKGELQVKDFLGKRNIKFTQQKTFKNCKYKKLLRFDFFLPEHNTCIEYDGIQHFKPVKYWGGSANLVESKKRDNIKNKFCYDNNIYLLRIRYDESIKEKMMELKL